MACNFASHNLTEVGQLILDYIKNGSADYSNMAPDFATGGNIINGQELSSIYTTGKGKIVLRGKYDIEQKGTKTLINFTEIPHGVKTEDLLDDIASLCEKETLKGISEMRNESGKKGLKIVFELAKGVSEQSILADLFAKTNFQKAISVNQVALVGKEPKLLNWNECIELYIAHNLEVIQRVTKFELNKIENRLEIVGGLLKALESIDNIITLIKSSASAAAAKDNLITKYQFTDNQAKAIVDMKLGKLANLETIELNQEKTKLENEAKELNTLLSSEDLQKEKLSNDLTSFINKYGDNRKTTVENLEISKGKVVETIIPEDVIITITKDGAVTRVPKSSVKTQKRGGKGAKSKDEIVLTTLSTNTIDTILLFTTSGMMYRLPVNKIPDNPKGTYLNSLVNLVDEEEIAAATTLTSKNTKKYVVFFTKKGLVKKTLLTEYTSTTRKNVGIIAIKLKEDDSIANIELMNEEEILLATTNGIAIRFASKDITAIGRNTSGVKGISLSSDDEVLCGNMIEENKSLAVVGQKGYGRLLKTTEEFPIQGRGGKGIIYSKDKVAGVVSATPGDSIMVCGNRTITIPVSDLPHLGRTAQGNIVLKDDSVKGVYII